MKSPGLLSIAAIVILQGCVGTNIAQLTTNQLVGKDANLVKDNLISKGFICGEEFTQKTVGEKQILDGVFVCVSSDKRLTCPESQKVTVFFEPESRKVLGIGKSSRSNCL